MNWRQMPSGPKLSRNAILLAAALAGAPAVPTSAQTLPPDAAVKAKAFKAADTSYVHALCDGSKSDRDEARATRARSVDDLEKAITDIAAQAPDVRKALDAAADAGEAADKVAADRDASDRDKSDAQEKLRAAKASLRDAVASERKRIEAQISQDFSVKFEPTADCPDQPRPKAAERRRSPPEKSVHARRENAAPARGERSAPASTAAAPASGFSFGVGGGGGGIGVSVGR